MICVIRNPLSYPGYTEEYDHEGLRELAEMAKAYVKYDKYRDHADFKAYRNSVPNGSYSDFSCGVWELMIELVRYGTRLAENHRES